MAQNRLFVGNLPFSMTEDELKAAFSEFGQVQNTTVVTDRETGRPRGFAFVEMDGDDAARAAIDGLNGRDFDGRSIHVDLARPRQQGGRGGGGGGRW